MDQYISINKLEGLEQPREVARFAITQLSDCSKVSASFHFSQQMALSGGLTNLQKLDVVDGKWVISKMNISHPTTILAVQVFKENAVATSSLQEVCIWSILLGEKLFQIEKFNLTRMVSLEGKFYGVREDGNVYHFKREVRQEQPMDIEESVNFSVKEGEVQEEV